MTQRRFLGQLMVVLASWNLCLPAHLLMAGDPPAKPDKPLIRDVALSRGGILQGQLTSRSGQPLAGQTITVARADGSAATKTRSDRDGHFHMAGLRGGVYQVSSPQATGVYRLWTNGTSPPAAVDQLLIVGQGQEVQRGQRPIGDIITNPLVIGLAIAAAIAIPVAVHNSKKDSPSGS